MDFMKAPSKRIGKTKDIDPVVVRFGLKNSRAHASRHAKLGDGWPSKASLDSRVAAIGNNREMIFGDNQPFLSLQSIQLDIGVDRKKNRAMIEPCSIQAAAYRSRYQNCM